VVVLPDLVVFTWEPVADATAYRVYSNLGSGLEVFTVAAEPSAAFYRQQGLRSGRTYLFRISAIRDGVESATARVEVVVPAWRVLGGGVQGNRARVAPTPTGLAAPTSTSTPALLLEVREGRSDWVDSLGRLHIVGEVVNRTDRVAANILLNLTVYGAADAVLLQERQPPLVGALAPGDRAPFHLVMAAPPDWQRYAIEATAAVGRLPELPLVVSETESGEDQAGFYQVTGRVQNTGGQRVDFPRVVVTLYNKDGLPIDAGFAVPSPAQLAPGEYGDFAVQLTNYPYAGTVRVQVAERR
jgi:hypothetical protein